MPSDGSPSRFDFHKLIASIREYARENPFQVAVLVVFALVVALALSVVGTAFYYQFMPASYFYHANEIHTCDTTAGDNEVQVYYDRTSRGSGTIDFQIDLERVIVRDGSPRYDTIDSQRYPGVSIGEGRKRSIIDYPLPSGIVPGMYRFEIAVEQRLPGDVIRTQVFTTDRFEVVSPGGPGNRSLPQPAGRAC